MAVYSIKHYKKAPSSQISIWRWLRDNLFSSITNSILTILAIYLLYLTIPPLLDWLLFNATFYGEKNSQCGVDGACWIYIEEKFNLFIYGFYPEDKYWRANLAIALPFAFMFFKRFIKQKYKIKSIIAMLIIYPIAAFILLYGGFGLEIVETNKWGGLLLTIVVAVVGIVASFPIGVFFALGRQSKMSVIRFFSIIYIEIIRGVPLITILFMASVILPLFFDEGMSFDKLLRALIGITLFQSAYIAEVVRGGLQAIPKSQFEAANSLGLNFLQKTFLIIMPQALKISIPNLVGSFISLFKDTTLVLIIGLFDVLAMVQLNSSDVEWLGHETEGYVFVTALLWIILYSMSRYSKRLEQRLNTEHKKD